jgi:IS30 family transposase
VIDIEQEQETVSVKEFAEALGWASSTVIRAIQQGRVKSLAHRAPGLRRVAEHRIPRSEIERMKRETPGQ